MEVKDLTVSDSRSMSRRFVRTPALRLAYLDHHTISSSHIRDTLGSGGPLPRAVREEKQTVVTMIVKHEVTATPAAVTEGIEVEAEVEAEVEVTNTTTPIRRTTRSAPVMMSRIRSPSTETGT